MTVDCSVIILIKKKPTEADPYIHCQHVQSLQCTAVFTSVQFYRWHRPRPRRPIRRPSIIVAELVSLAELVNLASLARAMLCAREVALLVQLSALWPWDASDSLARGSTGRSMHDSVLVLVVLG